MGEVNYCAYFHCYFMIISVLFEGLGIWVLQNLTRNTFHCSNCFKLRFCLVLNKTHLEYNLDLKLHWSCDSWGKNTQIPLSLSMSIQK